MTLENLIWVQQLTVIKSKKKAQTTKKNPNNNNQNKTQTEQLRKSLIDPGMFVFNCLKLVLSYPQFCKQFCSLNREIIP